MAQEANQNTDSDLRKALFVQAINKLHESRNQFLTDYRQALQSNNLVAAINYVIRAQYATLSRIQCFLELNETNSAIQKLRSEVKDYREISQTIIRKLLGQHPAIFLHSAMSNEDVEKFFVTQRWLHGVGLTDHKQDLQIIHELRNDFWNQELIPDDGNIFTQISSDILTQLTTGKPAKRFTDKLTDLSERLTQAEIAIENYSRLESFELELRYIRLEGKRFDEWRNALSSEEIEEKGSGLGLILLDKPVLLEDVA